MSRVLVVDDDRPLARALDDQPEGPRIRRHPGPRRPHRAHRGHPGAPGGRGPRPGAARPGWHRGARRDPRLVRRAGDRAVRPVDVRGEGRGAGCRRRRLRDQTVRDGRTPGPDPGLGPTRRHADRRRRDRTSSPPTTSPSTSAPTGSVAAEHGPADPHRMVAAGDPGPAPRQARPAEAAAHRDLGSRRPNSKPITCGSISPSSAANSNPIPRTPAT